MTDRVIYVKGRRIDQAKLREHLAEIDYDDWEQEDGTWKSPISGEIFATRFAMVGSFGTYLRDHVERDPDEPTRAGYMRAKRAGRDPTTEQRAAHARYVKARRKVGPKHAEAVSERVEAVENEPGREVKKERQLALRKERKAEQREASDELLAEIEQREEKQHAAAVVAAGLAAEWAAELAETPIDNGGGV
jgi:hypothetical protein